MLLIMFEYCVGLIAIVEIQILTLDGIATQEEALEEEVKAAEEAWE